MSSIPSKGPHTCNGSSINKRVVSSNMWDVHV